MSENKYTFIIQPVDIDQRLKEKGMSWDRYRCQNPKCKHYDMSHSDPKTYEDFEACNVKGCECKKFVFGDNYD